MLLPAPAVPQETPDVTFSLNGRETVDVTTLATGYIASQRVQCAGPTSSEDAVVTRVHGGMRIVALAGRICGLPTSRTVVIEDISAASERESRYLLRTLKYRHVITFQSEGSLSASYKITGHSQLAGNASELRIDATVTGGTLAEANIAVYRRGALETKLALRRERGTPIGIEVLYPFIAAVMEQQYRRYKP